MTDIEKYLIAGALQLKLNIVMTQRDLTRGLISKGDKRMLSKNALRDFGSLLKTGDFSDVTIIVEDGKEYKVHKAILAARSKLFRACFKDNEECHHTKFQLASVDAKSFEMFLKFIYEGEYNASLKEAADLMSLAIKLEVQELKQLCGNELEIAEKLNIKP
jgi:BTB/POZ domain